MHLQDASFLGGFDPLAFVYATTKKPGGGLYAIAADFSTGEVSMVLCLANLFLGQYMSICCERRGHSTSCCHCAWAYWTLTGFLRSRVLWCLQIGVFLNKGRSFTRVALIDAGSSKDSPCRSFVMTNPANRALTAICGNEVRPKKLRQTRAMQTHALMLFVCLGMPYVPALSRCNALSGTHLLTAALLQRCAVGAAV